ncbi:hypothetical protein BOTBODRAFT_29716 [Botryobasidium botryosum FD-172 SS1]|uniref:Anaphase-promoting complex subunit 11 n=1 Tax=Botryobasidium botryosum (strain FD-172 SS1) TaxID=930990 RepID=A0A067N182_BOTB1|nr:hypothetical protein BOTBODRAFT_29716 [Botryobasidium botryosum FD-172 SS1]
MKVTITRWDAIAHWRWQTRANDNGDNDDENDDDEGDLCGICRVPFEGCCPTCKMPGEDCPLLRGQCTHIFHLHCILKWVHSPQSKGQCPLDRREWVGL